jgi:hypothetical protein
MGLGERKKPRASDRATRLFPATQLLCLLSDTRALMLCKTELKRLLDGKLGEGTRLLSEFSRQLQHAARLRILVLMQVAMPGL